MQYSIREAIAEDMEYVLELIKELASFEKEPGAVEVTADDWFMMGLVLKNYSIVLLARAIEVLSEWPWFIIVILPGKAQ